MPTILESVLDFWVAHCMLPGALQIQPSKGSQSLSPSCLQTREHCPFPLLQQQGSTGKRSGQDYWENGDKLFRCREGAVLSNSCVCKALQQVCMCLPWVLSPSNGVVLATSSQWPSVKEEASATGQQFQSWAQQMILRYPGHHRVQMASSSWERKRCSSELDKAAAFLPSLVSSDYLGTSFQAVHGVLLFADISDFTSLTEHCIWKGGSQRGTDELAEDLNHYLCDVLEDMLTLGGDILKFAGDAVLLLWRARPSEMAKTISLVVHCSWQIQKKYRRHDMLVGQKFRLKIGISAGNMHHLRFGDERQQYFCVIGKALEDVCEAEKLAEAGEIVLSASCWELCEKHRLRTSHIAGKTAVKVTGMNQMSLSECQNVLDKLPQKEKCCFTENEYAVRPALFLNPDTDVGDILSYIPKAVLRKLEDRVPQDFLCELRPVTILFLHLNFDTKDIVSFRSVLSEVSSLMQEIVCPHKGEVNKVFLFDKGCTFLCVFGLPGVKLAHESIHALQSAFQIFNSCSKIIAKTGTVSVSVTSGMAFCGLIGHPLRHEYTVIGQKVNLAARMMMSYSGLVTCDTTTCASSGLPSCYFKELPERKMKGFKHPVTVYQYVGITTNSIFGMALAMKMPENASLLGRKKEIDLFVNCLEASNRFGQRHILAFEGARGAGKSQLLNHLSQLGQSAGCRVFGMELLEVNVRQSFSAMRILMARVMGLHECESCSAREHVLRTNLNGIIEESNYCLLNDIFLVKFPISDKVRQMHEMQRKEELHSTWAKVLEKTIDRNAIFVIDNAHFIDPASWSIMAPLLWNISVFMVMSLCPGFARTESFHKATANNLMSHKIICFQLEKLKPSAVVQKLCQDLRVVSIPRALVRFLVQRSLGIPYYLEELVHFLRCNDMLLFRTKKWGEKAEDSWENLNTFAVLESSLTASSRSRAGAAAMICIVRPGVNLDSTMLPSNLKEIVLAQLDEITPLEQTVLKFAAIIGPVFTTQLLSYILPIRMRHKMTTLLDSLVSDNILKWTESTEEPEDVQDPSKEPATPPQAEIGVETSPPSKQSVGCPFGVLMFHKPLLREAAYELWVQKQRVTLHSKCAAFLERYAHKCQSCGQGDFIVFHRFAVSSTQDKGSCKDFDDGDDPHSWKALVLAGKQLKKERFYISAGITDTQEEQEQQQQQAFVEEDFGATDREDNNALSCDCKGIVESVLVPLVHHYTTLGNAARAFYYLLETAAAYLHVSNYYMALRKLSEADILRNSLKSKANVISRFEDATFFSLKGEVCYGVGRTELAKKMIRKALSLLGRPFPRNRAEDFVRSQVEKLQCAAYVARRASSLPQKAQKKKLAWLLRQSRCLSLLEHLFRLEGTSAGWRLSCLAARMRASTDRAVDLYLSAACTSYDAGLEMII
ncbi:adenylate cyclase type 10-like [Pezoporus flaviventris]|uniref:adenylate cyclase type 10-like n=1 Tax=Pezoporus flaviventris TaxID=889875 RepID=UPI002AAF6FEC|nr:adenylate cyclase type 10-like [Pezoporus flaviventris]